MPKDPAAASNREASRSGWSNRVLMLALAGIFFLTFYPFRFAPRALTAAHRSPLLLAGVAKGGRSLEVYLNILLFMPFGFGVSEKLRERGWTRRATLFAALVAGFLLSYSIEFCQQYTPTRQSRWQDVLTNSTGAVAGFLLFELCGRFIIALASKAERSLRASLTLRRAAVVLPVYFALWIGLSVHLQKQARSINWASTSHPSAEWNRGGLRALGPGIALARLIHNVKPVEVAGYNFIYDALIFFPAGALFGMAVVPFRSQGVAAPLLLAVEFFAPPWLLDRILARTSGRPMSLESVFICLVLVAAGAVWINADRGRAAALN
jgi:hypothetical protein